MIKKSGLFQPFSVGLIYLFLSATGLKSATFSRGGELPLPTIEHRHLQELQWKLATEKRGELVELISFINQNEPNSEVLEEFEAKLFEIIGSYQALQSLTFRGQSLFLIYQHLKEVISKGFLYQLLFHKNDVVVIDDVEYKVKKAVVGKVLISLVVGGVSLAGVVFGFSYYLLHEIINNGESFDDFLKRELNCNH